MKKYKKCCSVFIGFFVLLVERAGNTKIIEMLNVNEDEIIQGKGKTEGDVG